MTYPAPTFFQLDDVLAITQINLHALTWKTWVMVIFCFALCCYCIAPFLSYTALSLWGYQLNIVGPQQTSVAIVVFHPFLLYYIYVLWCLLFHSSTVNFYPRRLILVTALQFAVLSATGGIKVNEPKMRNGTCAMLKLVYFLLLLASTLLSAHWYLSAIAL